MEFNMDEVIKNNKFNITDVLLLDHRYLKECIKVLKSRKADMRLKVKYSKTFLDALHKHSEAEKKVVYAPLVKVSAFKNYILQGEIEHGIVDSKVKTLIPKLTGVRTLSPELEMEMRVLAEIVELHLKEEENDIIPRMRRELDRTILNEMGFQFMKFRNFTTKDLRQYPKLQQEVSGIKRLGHRLSSEFMGRVQKNLIGKSL